MDIGKEVLITVPEAFFLDAAVGRRFCVAYRPVGRPKALVLLVQPLLEEMNKSRRMCALGARELADAGLLVLHMDLFGCGDSSGELGDASWDVWRADLELGVEWLRSQATAPLFVWGVRGGALLAGDWLEQGGVCDGLLLWHPVIDGRRHLVQFLRLSVAADLIDGTHERASVSGLLTELARGESVEVAGYLLAPGVAEGLDAARLAIPQGFGAAVALFELVGAAGPQPESELRRLAEQWAASECKVAHRDVPGPAFWQTQEIETSPALIAASCAALAGWLDAF